MLALYNVLLPLLLFGARVAAIFNPKIRRGLEGRKPLLDEVRNYYASATIRGPKVLIHVASFGELEQAKPVIAAIKAKDPEAHVHLTFFSPSGYENAVGKYAEPDVITYSPFDYRGDVRKFLEIAKPDLVLFARYDVWPNMALALNHRKIPAILFSATAAEGFFRGLPLIRNFYRAIYRSLAKILAVSDEDKTRFIALGIKPAVVEISGDTRFDQAAARRQSIEQSSENLLPEGICQTLGQKGTLVFIVGSSWPEDEAIFLKTLEESVDRKDNILSIIVPHETKESHISKLLQTFPQNAIRFSNIERWEGEPVVIVDSIGKLFGLYRHADIAMIGGGFGAGLHNILEAAVWGVPSIVGPKHSKSQEVITLIDRIAAFEVTNSREFNFVFWRLAESEDLRDSSGARAAEFIEENRGATARLMSEIQAIL